MIRAVVFDLDGVIVQTERLKAVSYARAVQKLLGLSEPDSRAVDAYREVVGASREQAARHIVDKLGLEGALAGRLAEFQSSHPWQVLSAVRLPIYAEMVADASTVREARNPHVVALVGKAREMSCKTGVATMSTRREVQRILEFLDLAKALDVVVTAEDISHGKPDPEVYFLAARKLGLAPEECLVIEDSLNGIKSGLAAGMAVVVLDTPFTTSAVHAERPVGAEWIACREEDLEGLVRRRIMEHNTVHKG